MYVYLTQTGIAFGKVSETKNKLTGDNGNSESIRDVCLRLYADLDDNRPDVTHLCRKLETSSNSETNIFNSQGPSIDSRTFTRPKKYTNRPTLTSVVNAEECARPKLQRRLTTTITPSPNLISKLEELSKNNNRPVSGNYENLNWEDGSEESLAEVRKPPPRIKRQSLPASLFDRLQELKKSNSNFKIPGIGEHVASRGSSHSEIRTNEMLEEARKVTAALDVDLKNSRSSRLSEIFRNTQDYYSDDNESFISLDDVSGFCDRLTLSTDQNTYSSIVREMEQREICLFHRNPKEEKVESRITFGGMEIPGGIYPRTMEKTLEDDNDLNRTYEIDEDEEPIKEKKNNTFEIRKSVSKHNKVNTTCESNRIPGLMDVVMQSDVVKTLSPSKNPEKTREILNNNENGNNNRTLTIHDQNNIMNYTYEKLNGTLGQNELNALNALHMEKYSTKVFDSSFRKAEPMIKSAGKRSNGKREQSDQSEDDCMSTTSDNSSRSVDSNSEIKNTEDVRNTAQQQKKKLSSTPIMGQVEKLDFDVVSPIRMDMGDGEAQVYSNPPSRRQSPRRLSSAIQQDTMHKHRMPNVRQSLKVPQRELKLKPALIRPSQNFKRPLSQISQPRISSEPSVPQKVESFQPVASATTLRPSGPTAVPSLTNIKPSSRVSGIPRPPTRLKQPQIRYI
ncbi:hypothetical protein RUM43_006635 [Polyplax serrata]|uniref:Uncharacterized protein n=1 Tax=Polyplax serrata TaxID=468196 RepID=A0AAN8PF82_POLSC